MNKQKQYFVIIVCDGKSPSVAANSLCEYILEQSIVRGQKCNATVISASEYREDMARKNKVIIIGHHVLSRNYSKRHK